MRASNRVNANVTRFSVENSASRILDMTLRISDPISRISDPTSKMSAESRQNHYMECIKMCYAKQINKQNAWKLHFIDFMQPFFKIQKKVNFINASEALTTGATIYALRVDDVHDVAHRMASGLKIVDNVYLQGHDETRDDEEDNGEGNNEPVVEKMKKKKQPKKVMKKRNIIKDINTLDLDDDKFERNVIDPMLSHLSSQLDVDDVNGLLMYNLRVNAQGMLILDSNSAIDKAALLYEEPMINISTIYKQLNDVFKSHSHIFPENISAFEFLKRDAILDCNMNYQNINGYNNNDDEFKNMQTDNNVPTADVSDYEFDGQQGNHYESEDHQDDLGNDVKQNHQTLLNAINLNVNDIASLLTDQDEYSYFDFNLFGTWAGPSHWKRLPKRKEEIERPKRTRRQYDEINFLTEKLPSDFNDESDEEEQNKDKIRLKKPTLKRWKENIFDLPNDYGFDISDWQLSFIGDAYFSYDSVDEKPVDTFLEDMQYYLPNNSQSHEDRYDDEKGYEFNNEYNEMPAVFEGDNLVEQREEINQINLPFARFAKKMDVRKLKNVMWDVLAADLVEEVSLFNF